MDIYCQNLTRLTYIWDPNCLLFNPNHWFYFSLLYLPFRLSHLLLNPKITPKLCCCFPQHQLTEAGSSSFKSYIKSRPNSVSIHVVSFFPLSLSCLELRKISFQFFPLQNPPIIELFSKNLV